MENEVLKAIKTQKMPYGKYEGTLLKNIPVSYLEWMEREKAYPKGKLGMQLHTLYEIKLNGLEYLLK